MTAELVERLTSVTGYPSPIGVVLDAMRHSDADESSVMEFAETIGGDPALSSALLRFANTRSLGSTSSVPTVRECVTRIGPRAARVVVLSHVLIAADANAAGAAVALGPLWRRGLARAIIARRLAQHLDPRRAGDAFQSAALVDLSIVALWTHDSAACLRLLESDDRAAAEHAVFGMSAAAMSAEMLHRWRVPKRVWAPIRGLSDAAVAPGGNGAGESARVEAIVEAAEAITASIISAGPGSASGGALITGLSIDAGLLRTLIAAAAEEFSHRSGLLECSPDDAGRLAAEARAKAQQTLAELSLATQLENRVMLRRQQELMRRVTTDSLTQIKNRLAFDERLSEEFERCQRSGKPLALFLVDLDHFKRFNDEHGHQAGDLMLRTAAAALAHAARRFDMVARYGGEEFVVIAPDCGPAGAAAVAERLRLSVEESSVDWHQQTFRCTASIGGAVLTPGSSQPTPSELVAAADRLLYEAKRAGRNRALVEVFGDRDVRVSDERPEAGRAEIARS
ncbi:MAG: diguanylate cyclase [Phycisphaerae bacterium]|nr:diguanylate cyclase [Phycisphaerae bacterium]